MRPNRFIDPTIQTDLQANEQLGYQPQRDLTRATEESARSVKPNLVTVSRGSRLLSRIISRFAFGDEFIVSANAETATVSINADALGIDTTQQTRVSIDVDLGPMPRYSGQFVLEDSAITDTSVVMIWHAGIGETDDEPELDGILCVPNDPASGRITVNWQAVPGPVSGPRAFRYLLAAAS